MKVVVVGAGLSGLTAAYRLEQEGADVVVLEARSRIGGRAWRIDVAGLPFDAGCEALDHAHVAVLRLAAELRVAVRQDEAWPHGHPPPALEREIAALARRIDPLHPEELDGAAELDRVTLGGWLSERGASAEELTAAETAYAVASSTVPVAEMSLLAYAAKLAAGAAPNGLRLRLEGGPSALAERLAKRLDVRTGAAVRAIEQGRGGVRVRLADGTSEPARRVVVAIPLTLQREVVFSPPLPEHRRLALARARYGAVVKAALVYAEPPPPRGLTPDGLVYQPYPDLPLLGVFAGGASSLNAGEIERLAGGEPRAVASVAWAREPFTRGSYLIFGPGDLTTWGHRLADPHGFVHFGGSEASALPSYAEGAVAAGERAAAEVLTAG